IWRHEKDAEMQQAPEPKSGGLRAVKIEVVTPSARRRLTASIAQSLPRWLTGVRSHHNRNITDGCCTGKPAAAPPGAFSASPVPTLPPGLSLTAADHRRQRRSQRSQPATRGVSRIFW